MRPLRDGILVGDGAAVDSILRNGESEDKRRFSLVSFFFSNGNSLSISISFPTKISAGSYGANAAAE